MPKIKFFARFRERIGVDVINLDVDGVSLKDIVEMIARDHPEVKEFIEEGFLAVNHRIVNDMKLIVKKNDEIAFLPKFSGG